MLKIVVILIVWIYAFSVILTREEYKSNKEILLPRFSFLFFFWWIIVVKNFIKRGIDNRIDSRLSDQNFTEYEEIESLNICKSDYDLYNPTCIDDVTGNKNKRQ